MHYGKFGVFTEKDIKLMSEAAKALGLGKVEVIGREEEGDATVLEIDEQFYITAVATKIEYKCIGCVRERDANKYVLEEGVYEPGSYWEPPSSDVVEFGEETSPLNAMAAIAHRILDYKIQNLFEGLSYSELEEDIFS
jgi:hypothetical protein